MQCYRCGATFEGRFCTQCGAPAAAAPPMLGWPCPRCGTVFQGNFCPRCGLPTAAWAYRPAMTATGGRSALSVLWILAMVGFLVFALTDFAGLIVSPTLVVPGIQGIETGQTVNAALDFNANWTFNAWGPGSTGSYQSAGGNPGGYLQTTLIGSAEGAFWMQPFRVTGSPPYASAIRLDILITGGLVSGRLLVFVDPSPSIPDPATAVGSVSYSGTVPWTAAGRFAADARVNQSRTYYLKIAFFADTSSGTVSVGFDNIRLAWTTDAGVVFYVPLPAPVVVYSSQDKGLFLAYYGIVALAILAAAGYYAVRERREEWAAIRAPLEAIGARLRSRSAWVAIAQTWMAVTFFQIVFILLLPLAGVEPTTPIQIGPSNAWVYLFELANAGVYEEIVFRAVLIGAPMTLGSVLLRIVDARRAGTSGGTGSVGRHAIGAWRYLLGGVLRSDSPVEAHLAAWVLLFASSAIFGLAHAPGWGWWKVVPAMVAGLGFGYLFLRHGIGAAILAHFVNDYAFALTYENLGGRGLEYFLTLLFLGLTIAGAGFFLWYVIDAWRHLSALSDRFRPSRVRRVPSVVGPYGGPTPQAFPSAPPAPPQGFPPPGFATPSPPSAAWPPPTSPSMTVRDPTHVPRDYTPSYVAPPYGYPPVRFQCPSCGWVEARYDAGRFTCTRCGRTA